MRAIEFLTEYRNRMYQYIKSIVPTWPDYVVKDWLYANFARGEIEGPNWSFRNVGEDIPKIIEGQKLSVDTKWQLVPNMKFTMDMWIPEIVVKLTSRAGGKSNPDQVPRDAERHTTQAQLAQQQGGVRKEPVILVKRPDGYDLLEGWHRTIQHFHKFPDGYTGPAYVAVEQGQQGVAEGKVINTYLWHGSRQKIPMLEPRQSVDTGGAAGSNQNAIYATSDPKVAIAMGLTTGGSDTGMFPNDPQMVLFSGKIRKGEYVYLHKLPFNGPDGKPQFVQGGNSREFHSIPGVEGIKPIEIKEIPVNKYLNLIRKATPSDLKLRKKYMKKQGISEGLNESLLSLVAQDQSERNEYKNFVKSQAGGDWSKGAKMYAQLKKRPSNDIFGDAARLNQFMKMKFDFDKFTDEDWDNYWLLAQHCDDNRDFQKNALSIIKKYQGTDNSHYKYLYDRISMGLTGKQKYGTQNIKKQGVAEGSLNEYRDQLWTWVQSKFPRTQWPEYVQRDFLYAKAKGNKNQKDLEDFLDEIQRDFGNCKWTLTKIPITLDIFTPKTQRMIQSREGGSSNPFQVPKDAERHAQQSQMIQQKGVSAEPIIVAKLSNGYDLIEGWHRTIQHLKAFPQGYTGPAWVCTGATYKSESVNQGVVEGEVVPLGKKHRGDLDSINSCSKCGGKLEGGTYMGQRIKVCLACKQVYLPPNSGIDQQGNKIKEQGVAEGLNELTNTSLKVKQPKDFVNTNDRKQVTWKVMKFKSGKDTYLINFTMQHPPAFGKKSKSNWNAVNVAFGVKEPQDDYSFGDEINTDLTARNKNQFLIYSTVINAIRKFITEYNTEIDEIIILGAGERQALMYQRFFQTAGKYFPGWHYDGIHSLVRDVPRQQAKKVREQGVAEGFSNDMSTEDMIAYLRQHHDTNLHQDYLNHVNTFSKFVLKDIPTNTIKTDLPGLDREKVERYKKMDQSKAPPIVLGGKYILDGYHRANAVKELGIPTIKAYVGVQGVEEGNFDSFKFGKPITFTAYHSSDSKIKRILPTDEFYFSDDRYTWEGNYLYKIKITLKNPYVVLDQKAGYEGHASDSLTKIKAAGYDGVIYTPHSVDYGFRQGVCFYPQRQISNIKLVNSDSGK